MDGRQYLILFITLVLATAFLYIWKRRDEGNEPKRLTTRIDQA